MKGREQYVYVLGAVVLVVVLYFGFDTRPSSQKSLEKSRALNTREFDITSLERETKPELTDEQSAYLETMEAQLAHVDQDSQKLRLNKNLSGFWFSLHQPLLAGLYAQKAAEIENTATAWSITGTTFASVLTTKTLDEKKTGFARDVAVDAFEKAISLEPDVVEHRVNKALCYVEAPVQDTPMKGIQLLAELATKYPESPVPPYQLARLAVRTGQYQRASERIEQALALDPHNSKYACLAVEIYKALGQPDKAGALSTYCTGNE